MPTHVATSADHHMDTDTSYHNVMLWEKAMLAINWISIAVHQVGPQMHLYCSVCSYSYNVKIMSSHDTPDISHQA